MDLKPLAGAALIAAATLALPAPALGAKGGGGGGGTTTCTPVVAVGSGTVDKPSSRKRVTADVLVTNCTGATVTIAFRIVPTRYTVRTYDPYTVEVCTGPAYGGRSGTLRAGSSEQYSASPVVPDCPENGYGTSPWGLDATYSVDYDVTVLNADTGDVLGNAVTTIRHAGGA